MDNTTTGVFYGLYYCNNCKDIDHYVVTEHVTISECRTCAQKVKVYESVFFAKSLMEKFMANARELNSLKKQQLVDAGIETDEEDEAELNPLMNVKLSQTDILATEEQHQPLLDWFQSRNAEPMFKYATVDMSGYFDEASEIIGKNHHIFKDIIKQIITAYQESRIDLTLDLSGYEPKDMQDITDTLRAFYSHSLFCKYNCNKKDKKISLKLQKATPIEEFFMGVWLEWFALTALLRFAKDQGEKYHFSCARSVQIEFDEENVHELDLVFMKDNTEPLVIECKTIEFREDIEKFQAIQKRLDIPAKNYMVLAADLTSEQAKSLTGMYGLTFLTLDGFADFIKEYY